MSYHRETSCLEIRGLERSYGLPVPTWAAVLSVDLLTHAQCYTNRRGNCTISRGSRSQLWRVRNIKRFLCNHDKKMDQVNSDASAPDSWDSLDDPGPVEISGEAKNVNEQLQSLNINAKPFVPNVNAPAFVPSFLRNQATEGVRSLFSYLRLLWLLLLNVIVWYPHDMISTWTLQR